MPSFGHMADVWLALGSNLGDRANYLASARRALQHAGVQPLRLSRVAETDPVGITNQPRFLNQVLEAATTLDPQALLATVKRIERELGRRPGPRWGPREIDIDILLYGKRVVDEKGLHIPHPELVNRPFLLELLTEVEPTLRHPVTGKTISGLLAAAGS